MSASLKSLPRSVTDTVEGYLADLDGRVPANYYETFLALVEPPMLKSLLIHARGNQSKAADMLGLNRATLRKKLTQYGIVARETKSARK
jgi:Fis family transcriptional regulator